MPTTTELYDEADKLKDAGDLDAAVAKLHEALELDADYALGHSALAVVEQRRGNHEKAIEHAKRVTELQPDDAFSFTALSVTYQRAYAGMGEMSYIQLAEDAMAKSREVEMNRG
ncbi:MAG: tetratricopeptide repeat protein [Planctomycetota bacterium]